MAEKCNNSNSNLCPLHIPYILNNIFKFLSVWNLKKCRLVCRQWNEESCKVLQTESKIVFRTEDQLNSCELIYLKHFCESIEVGKEINLETPSSSLKDFFDKYRHCIKSLNISTHRQCSSTWMREYVYNKLQNLEELYIAIPNFFEVESLFGKSSDVPHLFRLRRLNISDRMFNTPRDTVIWTQNIFRLLLSSPNLQRLIYLPAVESRARAFFEGMQSLQFRRLSHFHINHLSFKPNDIDIFKRKYCCLTYMHICITPQFQSEALNLLLQCCKDRLKELTLTFNQSTKCSDYHPILGLEKIKMLSVMTYEGKLEISSTPSLTTLVITLPDEPIQLERIEVNDNLEDLEIYDVPRKYVHKNLILLCNKFSNIRRLSLNYVTCGILRIIYADLPLLKGLSVVQHKLHGESSGEEVELGLTGIDSSDISKELLDKSIEEIMQLRKYPWISNLNDLKVLSLDVSGLSDLSVVLGISHCKNLKTLTLKNVEPRLANLVTDRSLMAIANRMDLNFLKLESYTQNCTEEVLNHLKEKLEWREIHIC